LQEILGLLLGKYKWLPGECLPTSAGIARSRLAKPLTHGAGYRLRAWRSKADFIKVG
jgi:hypothetical protein